MTAELTQSEITDAHYRRPVSVRLKLATTIWLMLMCAGMLRLNQYANQPAKSSGTVAEWPAQTLLTRQADSPQLLIFLHPRCSCSVVTVRQLATTCAQCANVPGITAVFYCPESEPTDWAYSGLWRQCERLPGASCVIDRGGQQAAEFGVTTSGHLLLFDQAGRRVFEGGITTARAHEGQSFGAEVLGKLLQGKTSERVNFPVFGCAIHADRPRNKIAMRIESD